MMATNYQSSKETTNFARICRLVIDVIPDLLRDLLKTRLPVLSAVLTNHKNKIFPLLNGNQKKFLYPDHGGVYQGPVKNLDTSLLYILLRNFGTILPHQKGWGNPPDSADRSLSANIDRLREQRNNAAHATVASLSDVEFKARWRIIRQSVEEIQNELNTGQFVVAVDGMLTIEMDDRMTNKYIADLLSDIKDDVADISGKLVTMETDMADVQDKVRKEVGAVRNEVVAVRDEVRGEVGTVRDEVVAVRDGVGAVGVEVGTVRDEVVAVRDEVRETIGAVRGEVGTVRGEIRAVRDDIGIVNERLTVLSGNRERDPKLTAMIETTTAVIMKEKDEYEFFSTKSLQEAYDKLMKNSLVVIRGNSGDGKTSIALELLRRLCYNEEGQQRRRPLKLHDIKDLDSVKPKSQLVIYLDDIFGNNVVCKQDVEEWEKREKSIISKFCGNEHTEGNFLIIAIRNGISNSLPCSCLEKVFTKQNIVDLKTDSEEKLKLLRLYKPKDNFASWKDDEEKEIVKGTPDIGFPQCCRLFRDTPTLQMERVDFFKRPFHFLKTSLSKLEDGKCYGLMYLFLNGGKVMEDDLDPNNENIDENLLEAAFANDVVRVTPTTELVHNTRSKGSKIEFVKDSLDCLSGWMVKKEPLFGWMVGKEPTREQKVYYTFNHDSIEETLALLYGEKTPIGYIQNCPIKFLSYVTTSNTTPNKVVISSDNQYNVIYKRLLSEFEYVYSSKYVYSIDFDTNSDRFYRYFITPLDVWTDIQFLQGFIRWLSGQNVDKNLCHEIKLVLFYRACSSGSEECALFLLSEGVKPNKQTPFCVVEGGSVSLLRQLLEYDVTQTARLDKSQSRYRGRNINVLQEACLFEREEMVTILFNTYPNLVHDTADWEQSTLHLVACTGNCDIFKKVERNILKSLCRVEDEQHKCERVEGRVVHRSCVCAQYMCQLVNMYEETVLHVSCGSSNMDVVKYLCESYPQLSTAIDGDGRTVLHVSCEYSNMDVVKYLCESYPQLTTAVDNDGWTVLHVSCESFGSNMDVIKYLCESYPQLITAVDNTGRTVLHFSCRNRFSNKDVVKYLCKSYPQLTTAVDNTGQTVLHVSCVYSNMDVVKYLCESYPQLTTAVDNTGRTVLHVSCRHSNMDVIKYLFESYPQLTTAVDNDGWHCLHFIARYKSDVNLFTECESVVKQYIISTGGKYDITTILTNQGESVLDLAKEGAKSRRENPLYDYLFRLFGQQKQ